MLALPTGRQEAFQALADRAAGRPAPPLVGNRHFFRSDMMVHHREGWYAFARMYSTRTFNTDGLSGTDDGLLSHYLAEGATCLMRHGNEYAGLYPVWDWQRISAQRSDRAVTDTVFTLAIPHGARPKGKGYAYAVFPDKEAAAMPDMTRRMPFEIVVNSAAQQAVWCGIDEALGIVFYGPGRMQATGWQVTADRACVPLLRRVGGAWTLSAADPAAGDGALSLTVKRDGEAPRRVTLTLYRAAGQEATWSRGRPICRPCGMCSGHRAAMN